MIAEFELHAFIDGEMADEERSNILEAAKNSVTLRAQLEQLQQLKHLVRASYLNAEDQVGDQAWETLEMTR